MKPSHLVYAAWMILGQCLFAQASEFEIKVTVDGEPSVDIHLKIDGDIATVTVEDAEEKFNLKEMSWLHDEANQWVTLEQCKTWLAQSKAKSLKSMDSAPPQVRSFLAWCLDPKFEVDESDDVLRLTSGQVDYVIEGEASKKDVEGYFRYAVLNAYKKAITERKLPPYAELKAIEAMQSRKVVPRKISVTIPAIPAAPSFEMELSEVKTAAP